jgi:anti-anti-sigma factor
MDPHADAVSVVPIPDGMRITFRGPIDFDVTALQKKLDEVVSHSPRLVELDLRKTQYIASLGIGVLVGFVNRIKVGGGNAQIVAIHKRAYEVLQMSRLTEVFQIQKSAVVG